MISIVMPHWNRRDVAVRVVLRLLDLYEGCDCEFIVVDDGSTEIFPFLHGVRVVQLAEKAGPKNPCVPYNRGVAAAKGDVIVLTGCDIYHGQPVLMRMLDHLQGPDDYVMAAVWCADRWHAHSSRDIQKTVPREIVMPSGAQFHFCTMLHRSLWDKVGGFDEDYREGAGYDDPDFVLRLAKAGARFIMCDDLVVEHIREGAHAPWTADMFTRNRELFQKKWGR